MKTIIQFTKTLITLIIIGATMSLFSCGGDEDDPNASTDRLQAVVATPEQTVLPFTEVTLDGSQSTGPDGFRYEWIYNGSETISLSSTSDPIVTFTPEKVGSYGFTLRLTHNGEFSETSAQVIVTGALSLDASIFDGGEENVELKDLGQEDLDYVIDQDFTIPEGKRLIVHSGSQITVGINDGVGIIMNGDLQLEGSSFLLLRASSSSWKGILLDGGSLQNNGGTLQIENAGSGLHEGQSEEAGITLLNGASVSGDIVIGQPAGDLGVLYDITANSTTPSGFLRVNNYKIAAKLPVALLNLTTSIAPQNYDYIEIATSGAAITEALPSGEFLFSGGKTFYLNDGFTAGSNVVISGANVYFSEDRGLLCSSNLTIRSGSLLKGLNDVAWKGVAGSGTMQISNATIEGAGSSVHNTGSFTSQEPAAIYSSLVSSSTSNLVVSSATIKDNQGYGIYFPNGVMGAVQSSNFENNELFDISIGINSPVGSVVASNNDWGTSLPVELRGGNISTYNVNLRDLGEGFSYLVSDNINATVGSLDLDPGVSLKFKADKGLSVSTNLEARGTDENPIIFDGEAGTSGSWKGIELLDTYQIEFCTITNGGSSAFIGADAANVVFGSGSDGLTPPQSQYLFNNNTVSNSAGAGSDVKLSSYNPLIDNSTNTFSGNTSQDSDGDGIPDDAEVPGCENDPGC